MKILSICAALLCALYAQLSWSDPFNEPASKDAGMAPLLSAHDPKSERFFSVGQMKSSIGIGWLCTATLVAGSDHPDPDKPALLLTAGHCAGGLTGDNEVIVDRTMGEGWTFTPSYFYDNKEQHVKIPIDRILYSTLKSTDLGVLQLGETYGQLLARGFKPMRMRALGTETPDIDIAHVPMGLFPDRYMRYSECSSRPAVAIYLSEREVRPRKDVPWFLPSANPHECIGIYSGSSGGPIFTRGAREIIGVVSSSMSEERNCVVGPCEIEGGQPIEKQGTSYFASVERLVESFKEDGSFDPTGLDPGTGIVILRQGNGDSLPDGPRVAGERRPVRWGMLIDESFESFRYKIGVADEIRCDQPKGYGEVESVLQQPLLDLATPMAPGVYALCAVGKRPGSEQWQPWSQATVKLMQVE